MDQVTTFMDEQLEACKRYEDDKILTKTMINNYAQKQSAPCPGEGKNIPRSMCWPCYSFTSFKNLLSINDIQSLLNPLTEHYFGNKAGFNMEDVYNEVFNLESTESEKLLKISGKNMHSPVRRSGNFRKWSGISAEFQIFICLLSYDVYIKKMIIESVIDNINSQNSKQIKKENSKRNPPKKTPFNPNGWL